MSAFLGPIHHWLYNKIEFQNTLVNDIVSYSESFRAMRGIAEELSKKYGELENKPLEDIIDEKNIHGWLQQKVSTVEYRMADVVTKLLSQDQDKLKDLERIFFEAGKERSASDKDDAVMVYRFITDTLLDGMPCDRANQLITEEAHLAIWIRNSCVHKSFWDEVEGDINIYYKLREALINGMLYGSEFVYERTDENTNQIRRRI